MPESIHRDFEPHQEAEELLPWYATGQLDADERSRVEQHLSTCSQCQRQLGFERRMIEEFSTLTPDIDAGWARLRHRVELPHQRKSREGWRKSVIRDAAALWQALTRFPVATVAVAQLGFVVLAAALLVSLSKPSYRALGSAVSSPSANAIAIFDAGITESQLSQLLRANGASVVGGPTSADAYFLRVPQSSRSAVLDRLRTDRHVVMAEPIDQASS